MRRVTAGLALLGLICVAGFSTGVSGASKTKSATNGEASEVEIYLRSPANHRHVLSLVIYPAEGVAVAYATFLGRAQDERGIAYAIAIPKGRFDGSLDLNFPGIGKVVGTVMPTTVRGPVGEARVCGEQYPSEAATFEGHLAFRVAKGYERFEAERVEASISPACDSSPRRGSGPRWLFAHMNGRGPGFEGDFIRFFADRESGWRRVEFLVIGDRRENHGTVIGFDRELLPGEIATQRWVKRSPVPFERTVDFAQHHDHPSRIVFTPPAPFFGRATYQRRTGKLIGSLGVHLPGLSLRLTQPPMTAVLEDEEPPID